jgi:glycosyltransferase involved in cell wall biosynthesis
MPKRPDPLRVLYVTPFAEPVSGPDESLLLLIEQLGSSVQPLVALPPGSPFRDRYRALGCNLLEGRISRLRRFRGAGEVGRYAMELCQSSGRLLAAARAERVNLVHANMEVCLEAGLVARILGVPCIFHYRGNTLDEPKVVFDVLARVWTTLGDRVFAISEGCADVFRRRGLGDRIEVLYNALELQRFTRRGPATDRARLRAELGLDDDHVVAIAVGRLHPRKDLPTLLRAAALLRSRPELRWLVVGGAHGPEGAAHEEELRRLLTELGLDSQVQLRGARRDVAALLGASDIFVMTSRHEGFGRAAAEAMAAGLPVVLTREGAFPELVDDGTHGLLCAPADPGAFADAVARLADAPALRTRLGVHARRRATERYDAARQADRVLEVYQDLTSTSRPASGFARSDPQGSAMLHRRPQG